MIQVIMVEDNEDDVFLTQRALTKANISSKLVVAKDGVEAIEYLSENPDNISSGVNLCPVVILLDLNLPRIEGFQVLNIFGGTTEPACVPLLSLLLLQNKLT